MEHEGLVAGRCGIIGIADQPGRSAGTAITAARNADAQSTRGK
jgi:hypothetical protein